MPVLFRIAALVLAVAVFAVVTAGPVMLLWGAIAGTYGLPSMGFGTAIQVCLLVGILGNIATDSSSKTSK